MRIEVFRPGMYQVFLTALAAILFFSSALRSGEEARQELLPPLNHHGAVLSVATSADGHQVLTGSYHNIAILWDADTARPLRIFAGHIGPVVSVAMSDDSKKVLTASNRDAAILWDVDTGKPLQSFKGPSAGMSFAALSSDGKRVLTRSRNNTVILWDGVTGKSILTINDPDGTVRTAALSRDGKRIFTGAKDGTGTLWDADTAKPLLTFNGHTEAVSCAAFSRDSNYVLSGSFDRTAILWDAKTGKAQQTFRGSQNMLRVVGFSADGKRVFACAARQVMLWETNTAKPLMPFKYYSHQGIPSVNPYAGAVNSVALLGDRGDILVGSDSTAAILWTATLDQTVRIFKADSVGIVARGLSGASGRVLTGSGKANAILWDAYTANPIQMLKEFRSHTFAALSRDGKRALTEVNGGLPILWNLIAGKPIHTFKDPANKVRFAALSEDGKRVLTVSQGETKIVWDADTAKPLRTLKPAFPDGFPGLEDFKKLEALLNPKARAEWHVPLDSRLSGDGKRVLVPGDDETMILYDVQAGKLVHTFKLPGDQPAWVSTTWFAMLSRDGNRILICPRGDTATLWDATGKALFPLKGHAAQVVAAVWSDDGKRLLTGSEDQTMILWNANTGERIQTFKGHHASVKQVAFGPREAFLISASWDGTVRFWKPGRETPLFSMLTAGEEWIFWTPEGYYSCSPGGEALIAWKVRDDSPKGYRIVSPEQFRKQFHRPDLFRHLLSELDLSRALALADKERGKTPSLPSNFARAIPPKATIVRPLKTREVIKTEECEIAARAISIGDNHVASMQLLIDGRPHDGGRTKFIVGEPKAGEVTRIWKVNLKPGKNLVRVVAEGISGETDESQEIEIVREDEEEAPPALFLLAVGVTEYQKISRGGVEFAGSDAKRFTAALLKHGKPLYPPPETITLTDGKATRGDILNAFDDLGNKARKAKNPMTVIFLAGHGKTSDPGGDGYFLAADSDPEKLRATAISSAQLRDALRDIPGRRLVFLDACYSGAFADKLYWELKSSDPGVVMICSSQRDEKSGQSRKEEGGYFTLAVVEGLSGGAAKEKNGNINLLQLFAFVHMRVGELSSGQQRPYVSHEALNRFGSLPLTRP